MNCILVSLKENSIIKVTKDTQVILDTYNINKSSEYTITLLFETPGISAEIIGIYNLQDNMSLSLTTIAHHIAPNTSCLTTIRGVLHTNCYSKYIGKIKIDKNAQQTSSFLDDSVLVLGEKTKHRSDPILEIEANDVKASHGSTTGRINESHIYYLQSRGLNIREAQDIIVQGYFESILSKITDATIKNKVKEYLIQNDE